MGEGEKVRREDPKKSKTGNKLKQEKACPVFEKNKEEQGITDKRFGSGLMADDFKFGEEIDEKQKVFGSPINRDEINIITFSDKMDEVFDGAWDVSSNRNGSVMAYIREICGLTELVIAGKNGICANENCSQLFAEYENLLQINFNGVFDTSRVTNMHSMFNGCYRLKNLNVSKFDTNRVTDMSWMFVDCEQIDQLDLSGFDTSQVTNMEYMFKGCEQLKKIDLSGFDTRQVNDMRFMFRNCKRLKELDVNGFNTSRVTNMGCMFGGCKQLRQLDLSGFDTSQVTDMRFMFGECRQLRRLNVSGFDTSQVTDIQYMFKGCEQLEKLDLSGFDISKVRNKYYMFGDCRKLSVCVPVGWLQNLR